MMRRNSKIYIAGHTGLLGSALLEKLSEYGYSNLITVTHNELDLTDKAKVDIFFEKEKPEYVFLAAGLTGGIMANKTYPATFFATNMAIQQNTFKSALRNGVKHLIFYGSSCIYPRDSMQPIKEEYLLLGKIEETSEAYAMAKIAGIFACKAYNKEYNTNLFVSLIPNSMYGPNDNLDPENSHVLSALIGKFHEAKIKKAGKVTLWGSGNPRREFICSSDVADASIFAVLNVNKLENACYNIGTGVDYSIKELAEVVSGTVGFNGKIEWDSDKPDGTPRKLLDSSKFLSFGWKPKIKFEDGLTLTYKRYLDSIRG